MVSMRCRSALEVLVTAAFWHPPGLRAWLGTVRGEGIAASIFTPVCTRSTQLPVYRDLIAAAVTWPRGASAAYQGPSGERYTGEEDVPSGHVTLKGPMLPSDKGATVYSSFYDIEAGKFKAWEAIMDTTAIPQDAEVLALPPMHTVRPWYSAAIESHRAMQNKHV